MKGKAMNNTTKWIVRMFVFLLAVRVAEVALFSFTGQQMFDVARAIAKGAGIQFNSEWARVVFLEDNAEALVIDITTDKTGFFRYRTLLNEAKIWVGNFSMWPIGKTGQFIYSMLLQNSRKKKKDEEPK